MLPNFYSKCLSIFYVTVIWDAILSFVFLLDLILFSSVLLAFLSSFSDEKFAFTAVLCWRYDMLWSSETFLLPEKWKNTVENINDSVAINFRKKEKFSWKTFLTSMLDFCHYSLMVLFSLLFFLTDKFLTPAKKTCYLKENDGIALNTFEYCWTLGIPLNILIRLKMIPWIQNGYLMKESSFLCDLRFQNQFKNLLKIYQEACYANNKCKVNIVSNTRNIRSLFQIQDKAKHFSCVIYEGNSSCVWILQRCCFKMNCT